MQIIDWERKGNLVRFFLGTNGPQYGDDWNDAPWEHNAGEVYGEFVRGHRDVVFPFEWDVLQPDDGELNSRYSKEDMVARVVPCLIAVPPTADMGWYLSFAHALTVQGVTRFYFGDAMEPQQGVTQWS